MSSQKVVLVALSLCFVCSLVVSTVAIGFQDQQELNAKISMRKNILIAADLVKADADAETIEQTYASRIEPVLFDFETGKAPSEEMAAKVGDPAEYQPRLAAKEPGLGVEIPSEFDPTANVKRRAKIGVAYRVKAESGSGVQSIILPIEGMGLWGTMYGYIALETDLTTVKGLIYYEHKETPGLGAEVDNPLWRAQWPGKTLFDDRGGYRFNVAKGKAADDTAPDEHQVDGLSGATITCNGVEEMLNYWMGPNAYGPYLTTLSRELN